MYQGHNTFLTTTINNINQEDLLVTIDVTSLYTNIIHKEGLNAMQDWMLQNNINYRRTEFIKTLGNLVLKHNYFEFSGQIFLQQQDTAMGTRMAPNYAIIFMHKIETGLLQKSPLQPTFFKRFIDDIFLIWPHREEQLQKFLKMINTHHKTIKFTEEQSKQQIAFLDTLVYKEDGKLLTKVYHKKTDQKQYLHYKLSHPKNQKDVVPHGLLIRARRICSKDTDFKEEATTIIKSLLKGGYPDNILLTAFNRAWSKTHKEWLKSTIKNEDNRIRLITTCNQRNPPMKKILQKYTDWLDKTKKNISSKDLQCTKKLETWNNC